jgi:hypothetical protein
MLYKIAVAYILICRIKFDINTMYTVQVTPEEVCEKLQNYFTLMIKKL